MSALAPPSDHVSSIMSTKVVTVKAGDKVSVALRSMVRHKIGSIIVVEKGRAIGIITERDISRSVAKAQNLGRMIVKSIMSKPLVTVPPSMEVWEAVELMLRKDIRRLPVIADDQIAGMVTEKDVMQWLVKVAYEPNIPEDLKKLLETRAQAHSLVGGQLR